MAQRKRAKAQESPADEPRVLLEHSTLQGEKLRVVMRHAPGIDYFIVVENWKNDKWEPVKRPLKELFSPVHSAVEVCILQLVQKLDEAQALLGNKQNPV